MQWWLMWQTSGENIFFREFVEYVRRRRMSRAFLEDATLFMRGTKITSRSNMCSISVWKLLALSISIASDSSTIIIIHLLHFMVIQISKFEKRHKLMEIFVLSPPPKKKKKKNRYRVNSIGSNLVLPYRVYKKMIRTILAQFFKSGLMVLCNLKKNNFWNHLSCFEDNK